MAPRVIVTGRGRLGAAEDSPGVLAPMLVALLSLRGGAEPVQLISAAALRFFRAVGADADRLRGDGNGPPRVGPP